MARLPKGLVRDDAGIARCWWGASTPDYAAYHDDEWGMPVDDDARLFEKICLEGFQSGLSWLTILRKRDNFRRAFSDFDFRAVARYNRRSVERLLKDAGIVRHRGKIESTVNNAVAPDRGQPVPALRRAGSGEPVDDLAGRAIRWLGRRASRRTRGAQPGHRRRTTWTRIHAVSEDDIAPGTYFGQAALASRCVRDGA